VAIGALTSQPRSTNEWTAETRGLVLTFHSKTPLRLLTKGDNNLADDTELYATGQSFLNRKEDVIGSVVGFIPFVGYVTILLSEHPWLKQVMLGLMGVMVVLQRE
jgi:signal peptidase